MVNPSDLGGFHPFNDAHAIYSCQLSAMVATRASWPNLLRHAQRSGKRLRFGAPVPSYGLTLTFNPQLVSLSLNRPSPTGQQQVGIEFVTMDDEGRLVERFLAAEDTINIQTFAYVRWAPFFARAREFMEEMISGYPGEELRAVKLEYWDRFDYRGDGTPDTASVIKANSPFVAASAFDHHQAWHSHIGKFVSLPGPNGRLLHVNVDVQDAPRPDSTLGRAINIYTAAEDMPALGGSISMPAAVDAFNDQHNALKALLAQVISTDAATRVALGA
jgi:uncharacterized protein (TIGR04255 family)